MLYEVITNNATTRVDPRVVEAMLPYLTEHFGNPSSRHALGGKAAEAVRAARRQVRALLGAAQDSEIIFTSCGSEADATAILSAVRAYPERREIVISAVEHAAVVAIVRDLEKEGYVVHEIVITSYSIHYTKLYDAAPDMRAPPKGSRWRRPPSRTR